MAALHLLALCLVGLGIGLLAGTFGIGGGVLAVPALGLLLGVDQHVAEGTSLAAIVPTTAWAATRYARKGLVRWAAAARIGGAAFVFGFAGAHISLALPSRVLLLLFAVFVLFLAFRSLRATVRGGRTEAATAAGPNTPQPAEAGRTAAPPARLASGTPLAVSQLGIGGAVGLLSGLLGIGGGTVAIPSLVILNGFPQQVAQGSTLAAIVLASLSGAGGYALAGRVQWLAALLLFAGASATVPVGAAIAHRLPEAQLRRAFAVLLVIIAALEAAHAL